MKHRLWSVSFGLVLLSAVAGCSVTGLAERERSIAVNRCQSSDDCPGGTVCNTTENRCLADSTTLETLLFDVSPTLASTNHVGQHFFQLGSELQLRNDNLLVLNGAAEVHGRVMTQPLEVCSLFFDGGKNQAADRSIPARITFIPRERTWGVPVANLAVSADSSESAPESYPFTAHVPAGVYDVYVEPFTVKFSSGEVLPPSCSLPPVLFRELSLEDGVTQLNLNVPVPDRLALEVQWPSGAGAFENWLVDMLEPRSGRVISTRSKPKITGSGDKLRYLALLDYVAVAGSENAAADQLVRLSPPAGATAPTLVFERAGLGLFSKDTAVIDQLSALPAPVSFSGSVTDADYAALKADLTLSASELDGLAPGSQAGFVRRTQTNDDGQFSLELLPGTYTVRAVPSQPVQPGAAPFAALTTTIKVARTPAQQAGRAIVLRRAEALSGQAVLPNGEGALGALVMAEVNPTSLSASVFQRALGEQPLVPRAVSTVIDDSGGGFTLYSDPGVFDLSVRPPEGSSSAWLVKPQVELGLASQSSRLSLPPAVAMGINVALRQGAANDPSASLSGAYVRAYALLDAAGELVSDPENAESAVAVGESQLDANGHVRIILPAKLDAPASNP